MPNDGPLSSDDDPALVRQALVRELETVTFYEALARRAVNPDAKAAFLRSATDEREHVSELVRLLSALDPEQALEFQRSGASPSVAQPPGPGLEPHKALRALSAPPSPHAFPLTIGSLRGAGQ
jgi:rubrerythrin